jgi:zinc protease
MGSEISSQSGSVTVNSLTAEWATALPLFTDVLRRPAFDPAQVDLGKKRLAEEIIRTPDSPDSLAFREFRRRLYAGNPRGRWATAEEVRHLTREDVEALHRSFFFPDRIILGFSGDFDRTHLLRTLEERLGDWQPAPRPLTRVPYPTDGEMDVALHLVDRDLPQTTLVLGHLAPPKDHPDHAALLVANFILGEGGFNSRMVREIRSDRGLAYSVGSYYRGDLGYGVLVASAKTRNDAVPEVLGRLTGIMEEMRSGGITPQELDWARDSILNGMIFRYDSPSAILSEAMSLAYDGLPGDFIDRLAAAIRALTPEEVSRAAARHLHPERLSTVILGRWSEFHHELPGDRARVRERVAPDGSVVPAE